VSRLRLLTTKIFSIKLPDSTENADAKVKINGCDRNSSGRNAKDVMAMACGQYFARSCPM
jgi:hypothetical protein